MDEIKKLSEELAKDVSAKASDAKKAVETKAAAAKKTVAKKTTATKKAATTKATTAKKTVAKKVAAVVKDPKVNVNLQFANKDLKLADIIKKVQAAEKNGKKYDIYLKPEEYKAYYVVDGKAGAVDL
ncbi:MAG: hypothetical protein II528_00165 [Lachnospiraceae bacterium]|nr:hypothetical protein [Lachnospiraceae bacterium]